MINYFKAASLLCYLGIACLPIWQPILIDFLIKPSDVFFGGAFLCWVTHIFTVSKIFYRSQELILLMIMVLSTIIISTVFAKFKFYLPMLSKDSVVLLIRLLFDCGLCLMIYDLKNKEISFENKVLYAYLSAGLLLLLIGSDYFYDGDRFIGLALNPNTAGFGFLISFSLAIGLLCTKWHFRQYFSSASLLVIACICFVLIVCTKSRGLLIMAFISPLILLLYTRKIKKKHIIITLIISFSILFIILSMNPSWQEKIALWLFRPKDGIYLGFNNLLNKYFWDPYYNPRMQSFFYYWDLIKQSNFFGLGLNFQAQFLSPWHGEYHGPNTILDLLVYGGLGLPISIIYLFVSLYKTQDTIATDSNRIAFAAITVLYLTALFFGSNIFNYSHWILLAIAYPILPNENLSKKLKLQELSDEVCVL